MLANVPEDWLARWREGRTGWHQVDGHAALKKYWPELREGSRVLVPLCGKSRDLLWLAAKGCEVTGVELSPIAIKEFFAESGLPFIKSRDTLPRYYNASAGISLVCGDYFEFSDEPFDALYDRGSLVALPADQRPLYVSHTKTLLKTDAKQLLITLEYDQGKASGPPYAVLANEVTRYWEDLLRVDSYDDIDNAPPKFQQAGLHELIEAVWKTGTRAAGDC